MNEDTQMTTTQSPSSAEAPPQKLVESEDEAVQMVLPGSDVPKWCSCRWVFCYMSCFAMMYVYALRVDISVAIVCMVKGDSKGNYSYEVPEGCSAPDGGGSKSAEFDWSSTMQANILGGFFYGYTISNIPGGFLADKYGGRRVFGFCIFTAAFMTILHPALSRVSPYFTLVLRIATGLVSGPFFPSMHSLWGRWAPQSERTKLMGICYAGPYMGNIITLIVSGWLCENGFDNGWGSIFYVIGIAGIVMVLVWFYIVRDTPDTHPRISAPEKEYMQKAVGVSTKVTKIPWVAIFKSRPVWAIIVAHFCYNWSNYTLLTVLPMFMKQVLLFNIKTNGLMSSIPYLGQFLGFTLIGYIADFIQQKEYLSTRGTRVLLQSISFLVCGGFLIATGFVKCTNAMVAVALLFFAAFFMGFSGGGFFCNHVDIAPSYSGILFGITNCISALAGFMAPFTATLLTPNHTQEEWQYVFIVCAGFMVFGTIFFAFFGKGELEPWGVAKQSDCDMDEKRDQYLNKSNSCWRSCCEKKTAKYNL